MRTLRAGLLAMVGPAAFAAAPGDWLPLEVGNQWIYRVAGASGAELVMVEVLDSADIEGQRYYLVTGLAEAPSWLRLSEDGTLYGYNRESDQEAVWLRFSAAAGETFASSMHPCNPTARIERRDGKLDTPAGSFTDAMIVSYPAPVCADAGLTSDAFVPTVGLVQRTTTTIAGPRILNLIYARVGARVSSPPEITLSLSLDQSVYPPTEDQSLTARITLRVRGTGPVELRFPTAQRFDLVIRDPHWRALYQWSEGKAFALVFGVERFGPGEKSWLVEVPLRSRDGLPLPPGNYTAECWLASESERRYAAAVGFELASPNYGPEGEPRPAGSLPPVEGVNP